MLAAAPEASPAPQAESVEQAQPVAWLKWEWNRTGQKSLVFERPAELSLSEQARGVVYDPLYASPPKAEAQPLTDEQILACVRSVGLPQPMGLTRDRGPYEVTEPSYFLQLLVRAIEAAHGIATKPVNPVEVLTRMAKAQDTRRQEWIAQGKCPDCEGTGMQGGQFSGGYWTCEPCNGTGGIATKQGGE